MNRKRKLMAVIVVLVCITLITLTPVFATRPSGSKILFNNYTQKSYSKSYEITAGSSSLRVMKASCNWSKGNIFKKDKMISETIGYLGSGQSVVARALIFQSANPRRTPKLSTYVTDNPGRLYNRAQAIAKRSHSDYVDCDAISQENVYNARFTFEGYGPVR